MNYCAASCSGRWAARPADMCQGWGSFPELFHFYAPPMLITCVCHKYAHIFLSYAYFFSYINLYSHILLIFFLIFLFFFFPYIIS